MMKKLICVMLCAMMALALPGALADNLTMMESSNEGFQTEYRYPRSEVVVGDTLYIVAEGSNGMELWFWRSGMEAPLLAGLMGNAASYSTLEEMEEAQAAQDTENPVDVLHAVSTLFTDGTRLMSLQPFTGLVFSIEAAEGSIKYTDVTTVQGAAEAVLHVEEDYSYLTSCNGAAVVGDTLFYVKEDWGANGNINEMHLFSLADGSHKVSQVEHVQRMCVYKDGKLLVQQYDYETAYDASTGTQANVTMAVYDPATDSLSSSKEMAGQTNPQYMDYSPALDAVLYLANGRVMGMKDMGEEKQFGYMPLSYCNGFAAVGNSVSAMDYSGVYVRDVTENFSTDDYLNLYGMYEDDGYRLFSSTYPNVPLYTNQKYYNDTEALGQAMVSGDSAIDVLQMNASYDMFFTLMDKGYCADLSGYPELVSYVDSLQPCLKEAVTKDGKLYAIPVDMNSWGWQVSTSVLEAVGLTMEDIPTNFVDMCAFLTRWNDEYLDEYPNYLPGDYIEDYKVFMFNQMMTEYLQYCVSQNMETKFDTPVFREMMAAVEAMRVDDLNRVSSESMANDGDYKEPLIMNGYQVVGDFGYLPNENGEYQNETRLLKMTLTKDTPYVCGTDVTVQFINPRTTHMEMAVNLLKCEIASLNDRQKHTMIVGETEAVPNASYEQMVAQGQETIAELEKQLAEAADEDKKDYQQWLESQKNYVENVMPKYQYDIWAGQIEAYQTELVPYMFVNRPTFMNATKDDAASELNTLITRYQEGQISLDQFIREADNKMRMMQMENY